MQKMLFTLFTLLLIFSYSPNVEAGPLKDAANAIKDKVSDAVDSVKDLGSTIKENTIDKNKEKTKKNWEYCERWCNERKDADEPCKFCSDKNQCGIGYRQAEQWGEGAGNGKRVSACVDSEYKKNSEANKRNCNAWCDARKDADEPCIECNTLNHCGPGLKKVEKWGGRGKNYSACITTNYSKNSKENERNCHKYCDDNNDCHKCSISPTCGGNYKQLEKFKDEFWSKTWYACEDTKYSENSRKNRKACNEWCAANRNNGCEFCKDKIGCGAGHTRVETFRSAWGENYFACELNGWGELTKAKLEKCEAWCKENNECLTCQSKLLVNLPFYEKIKTFDGKGKNVFAFKAKDGNSTLRKRRYTDPEVFSKAKTNESKGKNFFERFIIKKMYAALGSVYKNPIVQNLIKTKVKSEFNKAVQEEILGKTFEATEHIDVKITSFDTTVVIPTTVPGMAITNLKTNYDKSNIDLNGKITLNYMPAKSYIKAYIGATTRLLGLKNQVEITAKDPKVSYITGTITAKAKLPDCKHFDDPDNFQDIFDRTKGFQDVNDLESFVTLVNDKGASVLNNLNLSNFTMPKEGDLSSYITNYEQQLDDYMEITGEKFQEIIKKGTSQSDRIVENLNKLNQVYAEKIQGLIKEKQELEKKIATIDKSQTELDSKIEELNKKITEYETSITEVKLEIKDLERMAMSGTITGSYGATSYGSSSAYGSYSRSGNRGSSRSNSIQLTRKKNQLESLKQNLGRHNSTARRYNANSDRNRRNKLHLTKKVNTNTSKQTKIQQQLLASQALSGNINNVQSGKGKSAGQWKDKAEDAYDKSKRCAKGKVEIFVEVALTRVSAWTDMQGCYKGLCMDLSSQANEAIGEAVKDVLDEAPTEEFEYDYEFK